MPQRALVGSLPVVKPVANSSLLNRRSRKYGVSFVILLKILNPRHSNPPSFHETPEGRKTFVLRELDNSLDEPLHKFVNWAVISLTKRPSDNAVLLHFFVSVKRGASDLANAACLVPCACHREEETAAASLR